MEMNELTFNVKEPSELSDVQKTDRISTGIVKLDELLSGGYPKGRIILVSGTPGTGKTIVCFHYINAGIQNGEKCLYLR